MQTDHYFWIGKTHHFCEDYSLSGKKNDVYYCIVCDGCSGSPDTDFGARVLARAALEHIEYSDEDNFPDIVINTARNQAKLLGLNKYALDATLLTAVIIDGQCHLNMFGDGSIAIKQEGITIYEGSYPGNAPYYPSYLLDRDRNNIYLKLFNTNDNIKPIFNYHCYDENFNRTINTTSLLINKETDLPWLRASLPMNDVKFIALMSDGVESFERKIITEHSISSEPVSTSAIYKELLAFKNTNGDFVKRRCIKAVKDYDKSFVYNNDDVSLAVIFNEDYN